jgi:hypothetical protein
MRTSFFLSTLFTVSLVGGAALAEGPRAVDRFRAHGDIVDKVYSPHGSHAGGGASGVQTGAPMRQVRPAIDRGASRLNCSDTAVDCAASRSAGQRAAAGGAAGGMQVGQYNQRPPFLDRILGSDRTNFNEAGDDQGMSLRAAKRIWSHAGGAGHAASTGGKLPGATDRGSVRESGDKGGEARVSCNEGDECSMANKDVKKIWAAASARAGTLTHPEQKAPSNAERRIAEQRRAEGAASRAQDAANEAARHAAVHAGAEGAAHHGDHQH